MIITKTYILNYIKERIKSHPTTPVSAMTVRDVLNKIIDYIYGVTVLSGVTEIIIKGFGNNGQDSENGDWKITTDSDTKSLLKYKRKNNQWILVEEDMW